MQEFQGYEIKVEGKGTVTKSAPASEPIREDPTPTQSQGQDFNPDSSAKILDIDSGVVDREGGRSRGLDSTQELTNAASVKDLATSLTWPEEKGKWELYGFRANYIIPGTKDQLAVGDVRVYFNGRDEAMAAVRGRVYMHPQPDGNKLSCTITEGMPRIAFDESEKLQYVDEVWKRP